MENKHEKGCREGSGKECKRKRKVIAEKAAEKWGINEMISNAADECRA